MTTKIKTNFSKFKLASLAVRTYLILEKFFLLSISRFVKQEYFLGHPVQPSTLAGHQAIYKKCKTCRVDDVSLVRFPWQLIYVRVLSTKFC